MKKWLKTIGRYVVVSLLIVLTINGDMADFMPLLSYVMEENTQESRSFWDKVMMNELPIVVHAVEKANENPWMEDREQEDLLEEMLKENSLPENTSENELLEEMQTENDAIQNAVEPEVTEVRDVVETAFVKNEKLGSVDISVLMDYQTLISTFYTIDAGTSAGSNQLNVENFLSKDLTVSKEDAGPQILIYHTHSLEAFADSVAGDKSQTIVGAGEQLAKILTEQYGYHVLHHTEEYDTNRSDAYANSLPGLKKVLEENPSIQVVIDLHRDAGVKNVHRAITLNGRPTATFMFFNGLSRTKRTGDIDYLYNPNLEDNLAFSFQMQKTAAEYYPGITRKIYLKAYRYNMHLKPRTLLIELGDSNSTVEEVMNACEPLAHILDIVLSGEE